MATTTDRTETQELLTSMEKTIEDIQGRLKWDAMVRGDALGSSQYAYEQSARVAEQLQALRSLLAERD